MFKLVIQDDEGKTTVVPLIRDEITIGRKEGNTIRLTERNVSRRHARILRNNGEVHIEDLGSYNGIRVNNARIAERVSLRVSDQVQIGDYKLYLKAEGVEQVDDARTMPIERVDSQLATEVQAAVSAPTGAMTAQVPAQASSAPTSPMPVPPTPVPGAVTSGLQLVGNPARTMVAIADTDPQGRPVATAATVAALTAPAQYGKLVVLSSNFAGKEFELSRPQMIIGRTDENDIVVNHRSISRNHAKLVREPETGRYTVSDLQSSNGVRVNGQDYGKVELRRGDVVDLGHVRLRFIEPGEDFVFSRDAVITDVPDSSSKRGMMVAVIFAILLLGGVIAFFVMRNPEDSKIVSPTGKADADAGGTVVAGNDPLKADAEVVAEVQTDAPGSAAVVIPNGNGNDDAEAINMKCNDLAYGEKWDELAGCASELGKLGDKRADDFKAQAQREKPLKNAMARLTTALGANKLRQARDELDKIPKSSYYYDAARQAYSKTEGEIVNSLANVARNKVDKTCKQYQQFVSGIDGQQGKTVGDRVRAAVGCTPEQVAVKNPDGGNNGGGNPPPTPCDYGALKDKGMAFYQKGQYGGALSAFEDAISCNKDKFAYLMAALSACKAGKASDAKRYYKNVPEDRRNNVQQTCLASGIQL